MEWCSCRIVRSRCFPIVLILFFDSCSKIGLVKAMGILFPHLSESISMTSADLGIALGLFYAVGLFSTPFVASVIMRLTRPRFLLILGATMGSTPIVLASLVTCNLHVFTICAISGTGHCILRLTCLTALDRLAGQSFNVLYSLSTLGFSLGMVLFPFLAEELLTAYDWRGVFLILGGFMLHVIPCSIAIRITQEDFAQINNGLQRHPKVEDYLNPGPEGDNCCTDEATVNDRDDEAKDTARSPLLTPANGKETATINLERTSSDNELARQHWLDYIIGIPAKISSWFCETEFYSDPISIFIFLSIAITFFIYNGWHAFLVPHALQRGISQRNTVIITFVASVGNLSIRLIIASLTHKLVDPVNLHLVLTVINIISLLCDAFIPNFYVMLVMSCFSAAAVAGRGMLGILVIRNRFSSAYLPMALAVSNVVEAFGLFLGGYLSGFMADTYSTYDATFKLLASVDVLTFIFMLFPKLMKKPEESMD